MPDEVIAPYVKEFGGNPSIFRTDGPVCSYQSDDPGLDVAKWKENVQDYVSFKDLEALEASHAWWNSTPE